MAPILIDETGIKRLGILVVVALMLSFVGGYYLGNQQSRFFTEDGTNIQQISVTDSTASIEQNEADNQKKVAAASKSDSSEQPVSAKDSSKIVEVKEKVEAARVADRTVTGQTDQDENRSAKVDNAESTEQKSEAQEVADDEIKYSIQTAVYGHLSRAEKMMNQLLDNNIEAYVTDYVNKSDKVWYNVRFGYYKDKKSALAALENYKRKHKGDGYLVNFSAERIVDFDEQKYYEDSIELKPEQESVSRQQQPTSADKSLAKSDDGNKTDELSVSNTNAQLR